jgi:hypothetical protein
MNYDVVRRDGARNLSTTSAELEFSLVLARVIGSIESDPAQLRNAVYELARVKLQQETWQRHPPMSGMESRRLKLALEAAIDRVETISSRHDELRALRSLDRLVERSALIPPESISIAHNPIVTIEQPPSAASDALRSSTLLPSAAHAPRKRARNRHWSRNAQLLASCLAAVIGLVAYLFLDHQFGLFGHSSRVTPPVEAAAPVSQTSNAVARPTMQPQSTRLPVPLVYGVYAISGGKLNELEPLALRVPDPRVFMSAVLKTPSRTYLLDGHIEFIVFRRDIATSAPDRVAVRVIAKVTRAMTFNSKGSANVSPVDDEWAIRSTSYELRVAPASENPEMLVLQPENPSFVFPSGRYGLVLKSQAFDFTVAGPVKEASHCLERTEAANGTFYSECRYP